MAVKHLVHLKKNKKLAAHVALVLLHPVFDPISFYVAYQLLVLKVISELSDMTMLNNGA